MSIPSRPRIHRPRTTLVFWTAAAVLGACGSEDDASSAVESTATVRIVPDGGVGSYEPSDVRVLVGGSVEWVNESGYAHNVVFDDTTIEPSPLFTDGEQWASTFERTGAFSYICTLHPTMVGTVEVVATDD